MLRTRVGYCGGTKEKPSYYRLGDHTEAISIDYDPTVISYEDLLGYFWNAHRCDSINRSTQYRNALFYRNETQRKLAVVSREAQAKRLGISATEITTDIVPVGKFTYAEGYHQKYYLTRYDEIRDFLNETYPDSKSLADSTVATRLNAYLGSGMRLDWKKFREELPAYGLPEKLEGQLQTRIKDWGVEKTGIGSRRF